MNKEASVSLKEAANIVFLTPETAVFYKNGDFVGARIKEEDGEKNYDRVYLQRTFPFEMPDCYISVQNGDGDEAGIIRALSDFDAETNKILTTELERKYYTPKITKILSLKETRGYSYWKVMSDAGEISFTLQDTQRSISKVGEDRAFITDICGSRYEIPSLLNFDRKSLRKLEIYL